MTQQRPEDQLEEMIRLVADALFRTSEYHQFVTGIHLEWVRRENALQAHSAFVDEIYRSGFDAMIVAVLRVIDRTSDYSFHRLGELFISLARFDADWAGLGARLLAESAPTEGSVLHRAKRWRNKVVAHNAEAGYRPSFHADHKVSIDEIAIELQRLERLPSECGQTVFQQGLIIIEPTLKYRRDAERGLAELAR